MRERMASLPPEQRKMMESMMPAGMPGGLPADPPVVRKTSRTATIGGRSCKYVEVLDGTTLTNELCVVAPGTLTGGQTIYDAATKMGALMEQMLTSLDAPWLQQAAGRQVAEYGKIGGFPVASRSFENGKPATETKLQSAREEPLPAATFDVPSDYRRIDPMQGQ